MAKGLHFDTSVLKEALERFGASGSPLPPGRSLPLERPGPTAAPAPPATRQSRKRKAPAQGDENKESQAPRSRAGRARTQDSPKQVKGRAATPKQRSRASGMKLGGTTPFGFSAGPGRGPQVAPASAQELKALLQSQGMAVDGCEEKSQLEALWARFNFFRQRPLAELQATCTARGGPCFQSVVECARFLCSSAQATSSTASAGAPGTEVSREQETQREVARILRLSKTRFSNTTAWGLAVLEVESRDVAAVQKSYRLLMRKLHPDRAGLDPNVAKVVDLVREAKETCERGLSKVEPPRAPQSLRSEVLCAVPGRRKFRVLWSQPEPRETAPLRRFVVAAVDPAYGRALTVTVLEPDYSEELRRFVSIEDLTSYVLAEEELEKMTQFWQQATAIIQVAAANEAGQSPWASLKVALAQPQNTCCPVAAVAHAPKAPTPTPVRQRIPKSLSGPESDIFDRQLSKLKGLELRSWLELQKKATMMNWLRAKRVAAAGSKEDLIERVCLMVQDFLQPF